MQSKTHQSLSFRSLLAKSTDLSKLTAKIEQLYQVNQIIAKKIDPSLSNHCQVANLRDGILSLTTNSPAWHHKLRFASSDLLSALRADPRWCGLKSIEIKVDYLPNQQTNNQPNIRKLNPISAQSAALITQAADNISNRSLAAALKRLVKRSKQPSTDADTQ